jgi:peptidoglycan hydrolase-like protein with peptidoglycan-binding domain
MSEDKQYKQPVAVTPEELKAAIEAEYPTPAGPAVVSNNAVDDVKLSSCVFKNVHNRKSLTVHHLQRRLAELGYDLALQDADGYYADWTKVAVMSYQMDHGFTATGMVDAATLEKIFTNDPNVRIVN